MSGPHQGQTVLEAGEPGSRTPILALTANTLVEDRYACFEAGMDDYVSKPVRAQELFEAIARLQPSQSEVPAGADARK